MSNRSDNFNRADGSSGLGTPSDGGSAWVPLSSGAGTPTWGISANQASMVSTTGVHDLDYLESSVGDCDVQITLATVVDDCGLSARLSDGSNFLMVRAKGTVTSFDLFKCVGGSFTSLGTFSATPANGDIIKISMSGSSLTVFINGVSRITATDAFNSTATKHGLWGFSLPTTVRFDDFSATVPAAPSVPVSIFRQREEISSPLFVE